MGLMINRLPPRFRNLHSFSIKVNFVNNLFPDKIEIIYFSCQSSYWNEILVKTEFERKSFFCLSFFWKYLFDSRETFLGLAWLQSVAIQKCASRNWSITKSCGFKLFINWIRTIDAQESHWLCPKSQWSIVFSCVVAKYIFKFSIWNSTQKMTKCRIFTFL